MQLRSRIPINPTLRARLQQIVSTKEIEEAVKILGASIETIEIQNITKVTIRNNEIFEFQEITTNETRNKDKAQQT